MFGWSVDFFMEYLFPSVYTFAEGVLSIYPCWRIIFTFFAKDLMCSMLRFCIQVSTGVHTVSKTPSSVSYNYIRPFIRRIWASL
jgi:hypothetical protein